MVAAKILLPHDGSPLSAAVVEAIVPLLGPATEVTVFHVDDTDGAEHGDGRDPEVADHAIEQTVRWLESRGAPVKRTEVRNEDAAEAILDHIFLMKPDLVAMSTHGRSGVERWVRGSVAERVLRRCSVPLLMANPTANTETAFKRILVPLDQSATSEGVLDVLMPLAAAISDASLTFLHVDWESVTDTPATAERRRAERMPIHAAAFAPVLAVAAAAGVPAKLQVVHGDAALRILELAESGDHDLIAMTTHGRSGPSRWLFGSVTENVLRECRLPILLVRKSNDG